MTQEYIEIRGARENNLKDVSVRIPKRKITIFTGVSGSGKSSIVFDTIAAESQRLLNENFSMFVRNFLPRVPQPDADAIENLSMAVIVDQKRLGGGSHSTMGTITDIAPILRLLYSRVGQPYAGNVNAFSSMTRKVCARNATVSAACSEWMWKNRWTSPNHLGKALFCFQSMLLTSGIGTLLPSQVCLISTKSWPITPRRK